MDATDDTTASNPNDERKPEKTNGVHRRRSSIFCTRIVKFDQDEDSNKDTIIGNGLSKEEECNIEKDVEAFHLKEYIESLKQEKKDWQQEYKNRKVQCKNQTKQKTSLERQGQVLDLDMLTESERAFLLARPNYEYICKNSQKLLDMTIKISTLSELVYRVNQKFMEKMEDNVSKATKNLIKMSKQ